MDQGGRGPNERTRKRTYRCRELSPSGWTSLATIENRIGADAFCQRALRRSQLATCYTLHLHVCCWWSDTTCEEEHQSALGRDKAATSWATVQGVRQTISGDRARHSRSRGGQLASSARTSAGDQRRTRVQRSRPGLPLHATLPLSCLGPSSARHSICTLC